MAKAPRWEGGGPCYTQSIHPAPHVMRVIEHEFATFLHYLFSTSDISMVMVMIMITIIIIIICVW
jgi:hypothetical protein